MPLGVGPGSLPGFPVGVLPGWLAAQVEETARFTQTPADLAALVGLAVLSAVSGGRVMVEVRGSWQEPVNIYTVAALPPGSRKSAVFAEMTGPLLDIEADRVDTARSEISEAETLRRIADKEAVAAAAKAACMEPGADREDARAEAVSLAAAAEAIVIPPVPRLIADDVTPEAAASLLAEQGGRLAVLSAEGGLFGTMAGRYSSGQPNFEVFLKGHSGDMLRVDRKGRPPEYVRSPALTLGLCVQPEVLQQIAGIPGFRGRGLLARILFCLPEDLVGRRSVGERGIPAEVKDGYADAMKKLSSSLAEQAGRAVLSLSAGAAGRLLQAEHAIEPRLDAAGGSLAAIRDWASKLIGATARIAGLLHLAAHPEDWASLPVSEDTMNAAISIGRYLTKHALAVFDLMGADPATEAARTLLAWIERDRPQRFTRREIFSRVSRSQFRKAADLDVPLQVLEEHGYIQREPGPERVGRGRPASPAYQVHPSLTAETAITAET